MKASTPSGTLRVIPDCYILVPNGGRISFNNLPDISDKKSAHYNAESIIGRATPLYTYSHSETRTISINIHFFVTTPDDTVRNLQQLRWLQSALYPRIGTGGAPFIPPVVCQLKCGNLMADEPLCSVLIDCSVTFPTDAAWDERTFCPYKFDVQTTWWVVYTSNDLPSQDRIVNSGR